MNDTTVAAPANTADADAWEIQQSCRKRYLDGLGRLFGDAACGLSADGVETIRAAAGRFFDERVAARRAGFEQADGLTSSRISLVSDDQLELDIRLGELARRLGEANGPALWRLLLRFATLLRRPDLAGPDNPLYTEGIGSGLADMCIALGGGMERWAPLVDRLEAALGQGLPALYVELDAWLAERGIEPAQVPLNAPSRPASGAKPQMPAAPADTNPLATLQNLLMSRQAGPAAGLPATAPGAVPAGTVLPPGAAVVSAELLDQLLKRFDVLDRVDLSELDLFAAQSDNPGRELLFRSMKASSLGLPDSGATAATLDALGLIFEALFADARLPEAVRNVVSGLQIPYLKIALLDPAFFSAGDHPARRLVDALAHAAIGLPPEAAPDHPLATRLKRIAAEVRSGFDGSANAFAQGVADIEDAIAERTAAARAHSGIFAPLVDEARRRERLPDAVRAAVDKLLARRPPPAIAAFLGNEWKHLLELAGDENGSGSPAWQETLALADDLLWSVQPKQGADDRKRLTQMVPGLLGRLNAGLDRAGVSREARQPLLDACFTLQTAAIRGIAAPASPGLPPAPPEVRAEAPKLRPLAQDGLTLGHVILPGSGAGPLLMPPAWKEDDWLDLALPDGSRYRGQVVRIDLEEARVLLAHPDLDEAVYAPVIYVDRQLRAGQASLPGRPRLFDEAARQAMQTMAAQAG